MKPAIGLAAALAVALLVVAGARLASRSPAARAPRADQIAVSDPPAAAPRDPGPVGAGVPSDLPRSLRDSEPDGALALDRDGRLIVSAELRRFFDYFLSATGEEPDAAIRARIAAEIERRLPRAAADEALALLQRHLEYRARAAALGRADSADLETRLLELHELRSEIFGAEIAAALFEQEEAAQRAALAERRILLDPRLSADEKARALVELESRLPPAEREARAELRAELDHRRDERELRAAGVSDAELRALRVQRFGEAAAERLDALDRERAEWQARVAAYREAAARLDARERSALLERSFTPEERLRIAP